VIGLPSLSQLDGSATTRIWLAVQPADMRCSFDRLAELAASVTGDDPLSGHLFLFRARGGDRIKILCRLHQWLPDHWKKSSAACVKV